MFFQLRNFILSKLKRCSDQFYKVSAFVLVGLVTVFIISCDITDDTLPVEETEIYEYSFEESDFDWEPFFTGYNVGWSDKMELISDYRPLPEPLDTEQQSLFISGINHSDDVKMLFRKQIEGLQPNTTYDVQTTVRFATNAPEGCPGIGGPIGNAVRVITSASAEMPQQIVEDDYYLLNLQYESGDPQEWYQNSIIGHIGNTRDCDEDYIYEMKEVSSDSGHDTVTTDGEGNAWLMFGTRSGFEGQTSLFYTYFRAELSVI
ncbi:hypothetical protein DYD21_08695 [Rhodohalobacter sp. SW132]|uniref:hypothetical protein n=1 Tax=Rhodohalobacter sp. SW132 TaxID=2293433 RepID=UPI000E228FC8|nr:hypothetical protein [Rhodohalobacter sp. SW132]REL37849.1 hypothetical protein DYD21_08695 [Rhodohalobacter sp. SW132]